MKKWLGILMVLGLVFLPIAAYCEQEFLPQQNKVGAVGKTGKAWRLGSFGTLQLPEITTPSTNPPTDNGWLYVLDGGGSVQTLYFKDVAGTVTNLLQAGTPAWDKVGDPVATASITLGTYTNTFTGSAIAANQNQFLNTGNMGDFAIVYIQQLTGTPTDGKLLYGTMASTSVDGIQIYNSAADITATNVLLRLDYLDNDDTDGYYILARDNSSANTEFSVDMTGAIVGHSLNVSSTTLTATALTFVGAGGITTAAGTALTLAADDGVTAAEDLIITANNIQLLATGALTISPDVALTTAIILTDTDLTNALSVGDNNIIGTTGGFTYTAWSIDASGNFTTTGTLSGVTILQDAISAKSAATTLTLNGTGAGGVSIGTLAGTGAITLGGVGKATLVSLPAAVDLTMAGGQLSITDTAEGDLVTLLNSILVTSDILDITAGGTRTSGSVIKIADSATTASTIAIVASTQTSGKGISYTNAGAGILTGDAIYLAVTDGAGFTGSYINCFDGIASDFTIKRYGATVIAGNASGTDALTLTNGDILVSAGNIDITTGNFAIGTGAIALGADPADAGAIRLSNATYIMSEAAPTGTDISVIGVDSGELIQIGASGATGVTITPNTIITGTLSAGAGGFTVGATGATVVLTLNGHTFTAGSSIFTGTAGQTYTFPGTSATLARTDAGQTFTGVNVFTAPTFTTSITPSAAGGSTIGTADLEWGHVYLTDSAVIYAQANQGNTLTSASTGWTANLKFTAPTLVATATASLTLGTVNSVLGQAIFYGSTSGTVTLQPVVAAGTSVITMPARTGQVQLASAASVITPTAAAALTVGLSNVYTYAATDNEDVTMTASAGGTAGDEITIIFLTAGAGDEIVTFHATLIHSTGTLTLGTSAGKYYTIRFISNGTEWFEVSRTAVQT